MDKQYFNFTLREEGEIVVKSWIRLSDIMQAIFEGETLFLMIREKRTDLQPMEVPVVVKRGSGKDKSIRIDKDVQVRNVEDFFTIKITNKEDIDRFIAWIDTQSIG